MAASSPYTGAPIAVGRLQRGSRLNKRLSARDINLAAKLQKKVNIRKSRNFSPAPDKTHDKIMTYRTQKHKRHRLYITYVAHNNFVYRQSKI